MAVTLICPNLRCRSILQVPDEARGQKVRCAKCGKNFLVPPAEASIKASESAPTKTSDKSAS